MNHPAATTRAQLLAAYLEKRADLARFLTARLGSAAAADEPSPEEAASARQRLRLLVEAVETLPPKTRRAFKLHKFEGLSQAETAARLGVTRKTVEKQLAAALKQLVTTLAGRL